MLDGFNPDLDTGINEKFIDSVVSAAASLSKETNLINISVDYIRKIIFWSHTTGLEKNKVIIIENCEKMNESARNSMLKILEEPPEKCFFIFLSSNPGEIIETIRSRLRVYSLRERSLRGRSSPIWIRLKENICFICLCMTGSGRWRLE